MAAPASPLLHPDDLTRLRTANPRTRLLDVRTPAEFESQHIVGAYNVPLDTLAEHGAEIRAGVTDPVVLVCRSGQRARKAEEALRATGMANLHILDGGMAAWTAAGQPVIGTMLAVLPHNRPATCDVPAMVRALTAGVPATANQTAGQADTIAHSHP